MQPTRERAPWALLAILTLAYILSFVDRQFLTVAVQPLRTELHLSDVEISLLTGLAFAACYTLIGIPISWLSDRYRRTTIIAIGVLCWSVATAACGLARGFGELFVARMAVGVGEAALLPAAYSLIGDRFTSERTAVATGILGMGAALGAGIALLGGGWLMDYLGKFPLLGLPGWREAFLLFGAVGLVVAASVALFSDRRGPETPQPQAEREDVLDFFRERLAYFAPLTAAGVLLTMFGYGFTSWVPAFFMRVHGWTATEVGTSFGLAVLVFGLVAAPLWGLIGSKIQERTGRDPAIPLLTGVALVMALLAGVGPLMPTGRAALLLIGAIPLFSGVMIALLPASIVAATPPRLRARVMAIFLTCANLVGISIGPLAYAFVTERIFNDPAKIGWSLSVVSVVVLLLATMVLRLVRNDAGARPKLREAIA